jgi:hypothetical protein
MNLGKIGTLGTITLALVGVLALGTGCAAPSEDASTGGGSAAQVGSTELRATVETVRIDEKKTASNATELMTECAVSGTFLRVSGIGAAAAQALNAELASRELVDLRAAACEDPYSVESNTKALMNAHGVLSVEVAGNDYYSGAAHPNAWFYGRSYSLQTGKQLEIADVFSDETGRQFAEEAIAALEAGTEDQKALAESYRDSIRERPSGLSFVLLPEGVSVYFTAYAGHADFAIALETVLLPYAELRDALKGTSPAAGVWANAGGVASAP